MKSRDDHETEVKTSRTRVAGWNRLGVRVERVVEATLDGIELYWYEPLTDAMHRVKNPALFVALLPFWCLAFALPPLVIGLLMMIPWALAVVGLLSLVGVL